MWLANSSTSVLYSRPEEGVHKYMSRRKESFGDLLLMAPWWVSAGLGVLAYAGLRWILPAFAGQDKLV